CVGLLRVVSRASQILRTLPHWSYCVCVARYALGFVTPPNVLSQLFTLVTFARAAVPGSVQPAVAPQSNGASSSYSISERDVTWPETGIPVMIVTDTGSDTRLRAL